MTWIDLAWTLMASASLTLAGIHLFVWFKDRTQPAHLWFFMLAASVPLFGVFEILAIEAQTPSDYAFASRWAQVPLFLVVASLVGFVRTYFDAGRAWLAWSVIATRTLALMLNFASGVSVLHEEITGLAHGMLWGATISSPVGVVSPWFVVPQVSNILLLAFVADAAASLWRRGDKAARRHAVLVGGSLVLCVIVATIVGVAITVGGLRAPTPLTACFFLVVVAMDYELGRDLIQAAQVARELRESKRRSELAARAAQLAFWSWDPVRDEVWLSDKGLELFDLDPAERFDRATLFERIHPDDHDALQDATDRALRECGTFEQEFRVVPRSGGIRWIAARGQAEAAHPGDPSLLRGVSHDISARRQIEHELEERRNELAHLSRVATLGELSGSLAHEINQPLMGILSNAQAAQRFMAGDPPNLDEVREILVDIVEDDKRAGEVIRRLRALLKKGEVQHGPVDVRDVVGDVVRVTRNDLLNRDIALTLELTSDHLPVLGDRIQLQQVLLNLVMNASDAMAGAERREIRIAVQPAECSAVEIAVCDSGTGIPPMDIERIFEPFVSTKELGMGLGLSVCRTIVAAHGGRLWAENNAGNGATFRLTLPFVLADAK